jgi:branched-subunit amino acid aminotransferase/4-amino-4-deoxychorismate lyase
MNSSDLFRMELNGVPVQVEDFKTLWLSRNYGHYTVLPVQDGKVRGLAHHMARLQQNTQILYSCELDTSRVRAFVRHALDATTARQEALVNVFSRSGNRDPLKHIEELDVLVTVMEAPDVSPGPQRVRSVRYERDLPRVKHVGTFGLNYQYRQAQLDGFDDALFVDAAGRILEGSISNVGFFDGQRIIWPSAPALPGVSMQLIQTGLKERRMPFEVREVRLQDLSMFRSAFFTNCRVGAQVIASIDQVTFVVDAELNALLKECYETGPLEEV